MKVFDLLFGSQHSFLERSAYTTIEVGIRYFLFASIAWVLGYRLFRSRWLHRKIIARFPASAEVRREVRYSLLTLVIFGLVGAATGFYNGLIGPGTGTLMVFAFVSVIGLDFLRASAVSKAANVAADLSSWTVLLMGGYVRWIVVLPLIIPTRILDEANVIVALTLYTVALLVRAVPEALDAVPAQVRDAATAVGYRPLTRMLKVELPLALPVLIASLRVVAVTNISMVAVGSVIGIGGLGTWFTEGYQADKSDQILAGIIAIFVLAIVIDTLIMVLGRVLTPWTRAVVPA